MPDDNPKCPNGHPANASGQCSVNNCPHSYVGRHDGIGQPDRED